MFDLPFATGFYVNEISTLADKRCLNWIPIKAESGALNPEALLDRRGVVHFADLPGTFRGDVVFRNEYYTLNGITLNKVLADGSLVYIGDIPESGLVSIAVNDDYIVFVVQSGAGYFYDASTIQQITDSDYLPASSVVFIDGHFLFTEKSGERFFFSEVNDPSDFNPLDRSTAEERPDLIVCAFVYQNILHIAGTETIEKYNNTGGLRDTFQRINQATNDVGCYARLSPIEAGGGIIFLGGSKNHGVQVYAMSGGSAQLISTTAIDKALQDYTAIEISNAIGWTYQLNGQLLYGITVRSDRIDSRTFVLNLTSGLWCEFSSDGADYVGRSVTRVYDKFIVASDGKCGLLSDVHTDYGNVIRREITTQPFLSENGQAFNIGKLEAWFEQGTGSTTNPQVMMQTSDDLGKTWSFERWVGIGAVGQYGIRSQWRRLGRCNRNRMFKFAATDDYTFNFMKLTAQ